MTKPLYLLALLLSMQCAAQSTKSLPVIRSNQQLISIRTGKALQKNAWSISPQVKPDIHIADIQDKSSQVTFITDVDSISFKVKPGERYDFVILLNGKDSAYTEIKGRKYIRPARFSNSYIKAHNGKTYCEIPEVYELVNVMMAISPSLIQQNGPVYKRTRYYQDVQKTFGPYSSSKAVKTMDSLLKNDGYFRLKMDAYAFEFSTKGKVVQSKVYDRLSWGSENTLRPYLPLVQQFADQTNFRAFFRRHQPFYNQQIAGYRDSVNTTEMIGWLRRNFPGSDYNSFKIIWSPLVGYNQSANWFEDNGFKEMQAHVNFPYKENNTLPGISAASRDMSRGDIAFTEINHSFINPEGDKESFAAGIDTAFRDLNVWAEGIALNNYGTPHLCFNEYMNWALVPLRYLDYAPKEDFEKLKTNIDVMMVKRRGFKRFKEFDDYLVNLYRNRKTGVTVADLYPQVVDWFVNNK